MTNYDLERKNTCLEQTKLKLEEFRYELNRAETRAKTLANSSAKSIAWNSRAITELKAAIVELELAE